MLECRMSVMVELMNEGSVVVKEEWTLEEEP